jgi:hypothetical protein
MIFGLVLGLNTGLRRREGSWQWREAIREFYRVDPLSMQVEIFDKFMINTHFRRKHLWRGMNKVIVHVPATHKH